jgi:hypothetical protein
MRPDANVHVIGAMGAWNAANATPKHLTDIILSVPADYDVWQACEEALSDVPHLTIEGNADPGSEAIKGVTLSSSDFLGALKAAKVIVGNSSCGLIEAPSAGTYTVNVGSRQAGRERASSVIDVPVDAAAIRTAVEWCVQLPAPSVINPYYAGNSVEKAAQTIERWLSC